jgi:N-acetylneuraminic acid mutarotase
LKTLLITKIVLGLFYFSLAQPLSDFPVPIGAGDAEVFNDSIYHFGGSDTWIGSNSYPRVYLFDGNSWSHHDTIPDNNVWEFTTTLVANFVYVFEGYPSGGGLNRRYNLITGNWTYLANSPSVFQNYGVTSEEVNGFIYLFVLPGHVFEYNIIANSWTQKTSNSVSSNSDLTSVEYEDEIYIRGWSDDSFYKYTPSSDSWTKLADLPYHVEACGMGIVNNLIYCMGGNDGGGAAADYSTIIVYNITTNTWTTDPSQLSGKRHFMASVEYKGGLYTIGGFDETGNGVTIIGEIVPQGTSGISQISEIPNGYSLSQNYPNPFNPSTSIQFSIPSQTFVKLEVFNSLGEKVSTLVAEELNVGNYQYEWNAENLASGIYYYKLSTIDFVQTKKLALLK